MHFRSAARTVPRCGMLPEPWINLDEDPPGSLRSCFKLTKNSNFTQGLWIKPPVIFHPSLEVSGHSSKLPLYPRLFFFLPKLSRQPHYKGPRSLSGKISQDTLEKSCTDLGQVRLCFEWLWSMKGPVPSGNADIIWGPLQVACPLQAFSSHSN